MARAYVNEAHIIRIPVHIWEKRSKLFEWRNKYKDQHGVYPTNEETMEKFKINIEAIEKLLHGRPASLDKKVSHDWDADTLGDFLADENAKPPEEDVLRHEIHAALMAAVKTLVPRDILIFSALQGLGLSIDGMGNVHIDAAKFGDKQTLDAVGQQFGLTRERIRQINARVLMKLHNPLDPALRSLHGAARDLGILQGEGSEARLYDKPELNKLLAELGLSKRTVNALQLEGIFSLGDLVSPSSEDLLEVPRFGALMLEECTKLVADQGHSLGEEPE